jgi:hypothetical protein
VNTLQDLRRLLSDEVNRLQPPAGLEARVLQRALRSSETVDQTPRRRQRGVIRPTRSEPVAAPRLITLVAAVLAVLIVVSLALAARALHPKSMVPAHPGPVPTALIPSAPIPPSLAANGWIAYSTDGRTPGLTDITTGSDIYLVRAGVKPKLVAGRDGGNIRNVCPVFSPDGRRLAYGVDAKIGRALVVLGLDSHGAIATTARFSVSGSGSVVCPRWSADGLRVAYLEGATNVVVRGLDGSTLGGVAGDPSVKDFGLGRQFSDALLSPKGDRLARLQVTGSACQIVVTKPNGTAAHVFPLDRNCGYAIPAWSPDGRQVLLMQDVSGIDFTMRAFTVDNPFDVVTIVSTVRTNGARSWPGWGDVSWQPVLPAMPQGDAPLNAGTYAFDFSQLDAPGKPFPKVLITVPAGWSVSGGLFVHTLVGTQRQIAVSFWNVVDVYATGCHWLSPPAIHSGPTVDELAAVLAARPLRNATAPVAASLGGFNGKFLQWSVPTDVNFADCDKDPSDGVRYFESWTGAGLSDSSKTDRYQQEPGQVDRLWILDVHGRRLVIDAAYWPGSTDQDRADLQRVVNSIVFRA